MKKNISLFLILSGCIAVNAQTDLQKVETLLKKMTLEEKVGQMTQITLAIVAKGGWSNQDGSIDHAALKKAVVDYKFGYILNTTTNEI